MAKTETIAGVVPVPRGPYDSGNTYYKYNLTQLYGSTYMSKIDDNTTAPATMDAEGNITVNENWEVWADASGIPALQKELLSKPSIYDTTRSSELERIGVTKLTDKVIPGKNGKTFPIFIEKNKNYTFRLSSGEGSNISINIFAIKQDGDTDIIWSPTVTESGIENTLSFDKNYYGLYIYYSVSAVGSEVTLEINRNKLDYFPDSLGNGVNIYPDPFMTSKDKLTDLKGIKNIVTVGDIEYKENEIVIPVGGFLGVILDLTILPYNPSEDFLNILALAEGTGNYYVSVGFNPTSSSYTEVIKTKKDVNYNGWLSLYNITGKQTTDNTIRISFDNRSGEAPMIVKQCLMYLGQDKQPVGLFNKTAWDAWNKIKDVEFYNDYINYAPYYTNFTITSKPASDYVKIEKDYLNIVASTTPTIIFGYEFNLADSDFNIGDNLLFGCDVVENTFAQIRMFCIFYNSAGGEISRKGFFLSSQGIQYDNLVIPDTTEKVLLRFQTGTGTVSGMTFTAKENYLIKSDSLIAPYKFIRQPLQGGSKDAKYNLVYVDAVNGDDSNNGSSELLALKTFGKAYSVISDDATIILIGDIYESFNIKGNPTQKSLNLIGKRGAFNRILGGTFISDADLVEGTTSVYSKIIEQTFSTAEEFNLFQHEIADTSTLIADNERHSLQRGRTYRCESTVINRTTTLEDVKSSEDLKFYYDTETKTLYFKITEGSNLADNPVVIPTTAKITGNDGTVSFNMTNIEIWYGTGSLKYCHGANITDCASKYGQGAGSWAWDGSIGIKFTRCEAARTFTGTGTGDGFNAHSTKTDPANVKHTTATLIDCWSHDNDDDGFSDHERCETTIIGGLYENNTKAGLTPAYGAHDTIYNVYCRNNVHGGISLVGSAASDEGGRGSQIYVYNSVCENNEWNFNVSGDAGGTDDNLAVFIGCASINASIVGYQCGTKSKMILINCTDQGSTEVKTGNIEIKNGVLVE